MSIKDCYQKPLPGKVIKELKNNFEQLCEFLGESPPKSKFGQTLSQKTFFSNSLYDIQSKALSKPYGLPPSM